VKKLVNPGEIIPRFYGYTYFHPTYNASVYFPIPINFLVRWFLPLYLYLTFPGRSFWEKNTYVIERFRAPIKKDGEITYIDLEEIKK